MMFNYGHFEVAGKSVWQSDTKPEYAIRVQSFPNENHTKPDCEEMYFIKELHFLFYFLFLFYFSANKFYKPKELLYDGIT